MKLIKQLILLILFTHILYGEVFNKDTTIHLLVENDIDYNIAKDIKKITERSMNINIYYGTHLQIIDKVLTDPKAQFAIVPYDVLLYKRDIERVDGFEKNIKMILPLYDEDIYIIVRANSNIKTIQDLKNKKVNIDIGKNSFSTIGRLLKHKHRIDWIESHYKSKNAIKKLIDKNIDAVILIESKPSSTLSKISDKDGKKLTLISPTLGSDYKVSYINPSHYSWLNKEVETNSLTTMLISYNYQKSKIIKRFNYYVQNISNLIDAISRNMDNIREDGDSYWKIIYPYYYKRVKWSLHSVAKESIFRNMDRLGEFINTIGMRFKKLPSGSFEMGSSDKTLPKNEQPKTDKRVNSFYIQTTEVTQAQWNRLMSGNPSYFKSDRLHQNSSLYPVDNISYRDAIQFIEKLNFLEGRNNYRLPSEIEWEYASNSDSSNIEDVAWFAKNSNNHTHQVALKKPNKWGLYDMRGNLWEWCSSYYSNNYKDNKKDKDFRVLRGGSFLNLATNTRSKNRMRNIDTIIRFNNGFRVVYDKASIVENNKKYIVKKGDTLASIAYKFYKNSKRWDIIYYANRDTIGKNPSNIYIKSQLTIPQIRQFKFKKEDKEFNKNVSANGIKLLSGTDFKPFLSPTLPYGGMANHIVQEIFEINGDNDYKIFWNKDFSTHFDMLESGKADVGIAWYKPDCNKTNLSKDAQRRCKFKFSKPIFETISTLYKRNDNKINPLSPKDVYNSKICRPKGIYTFDLTNQGLIDGKTIKLIRPSNKKDCFTLLVENRVDFVAVDKFSGSAIISEMRIGDIISSIETISTLLEMNLIVHSSNPRVDEIIGKLNSGISKLYKNGRMQEIQSNHLSNFFSNEK